MRCFKKIFTTGSQRLPLGSDRSLPCFWYCRFPLACCPQRLRCSLARQWPQACHLCWQNAIVCFLFLYPGSLLPDFWFQAFRLQLRFFLTLFFFARIRLS